MIYVRDYTEFPGPRFAKLGPSSGEEFRDTILIPQLEAADGEISVNLDGTMGYGSSFLEEAFGGLIRKGVSPELAKKLSSNLISEEDPSLIIEIQSYIADEVGKAQ